MTLVESHAHGAVIELRLARAPVNALSPAMCDAIRRGLEDAIAAGAQGVVLAGGPKVFCAGLDVPHLLALGHDRAALLAAWTAFFETARAFATCPVPVVAAMAGHAPAGGCVLALCCDYRVMASGAYRIGLNETQVGLVAPEGIQRLLRRVVGSHRAERLLVSGDLIDAATALGFGLVDELIDVSVEPAAVTQRAVAWLDTLLTLPREAMLQTRAIARADLVEALEPRHIELERFIDAWQSPGTQAALHALVARLGK